MFLQRRIGPQLLFQHASVTPSPQLLFATGKVLLKLRSILPKLGLTFRQLGNRGIHLVALCKHLQSQSFEVRLDIVPGLLQSRSGRFR